MLFNGTSTARVWYSIAIMYVLLTSAMAGCFIFSDWTKLSEKAIAASSSNDAATAMQQQQRGKIATAEPVETRSVEGD